MNADRQIILRPNIKKSEEIKIPEGVVEETIESLYATVTVTANTKVPLVYNSMYKFTTDTVPPGFVEFGDKPSDSEVTQYAKKIFQLNCDHFVPIRATSNTEKTIDNQGKPSREEERKLLDANFIIQDGINTLVAYFENLKPMAVVLNDFCPYKLQDGQKARLLAMYDIYYTPNVRAFDIHGEEAVSAGTLILAAKTNKKTVSTSLIIDQKGLQTFKEGGVENEMICSTTFVKVVINGTEYTIGGAYGSVFSSPESRKNTYLGQITALEKLTENGGKALIVGDLNTYGPVDTSQGPNGREVKFLASFFNRNNYENLDRRFLAIIRGFEYLGTDSPTFLGDSEAHTKKGKLGDKLLAFLKIATFKIIPQYLDASFGNCGKAIETKKFVSTDHLATITHVE